MNKRTLSVAISIYKSDVPEYLQTALESIISQTLKPQEIVVVGDGPVPATLEQVVSTCKEKAAEEGITLNYLPQSVNRGLGEALRIACEHCSCDYIARMDSDDISLPQRFEKQMACFERDGELGMVGGMITEFVGEPTNIVSRRELPLDNAAIYKMMRHRCGVNHVTVIIRKADLMKAGNYSGRFRQEDYYLWARMMEQGVKIANIPDVVVNVRSGIDQFARRGGLKYFRQHMQVFKWMRRHGLISRWVLWQNYVLRFAQVAFPDKARNWVYVHVLRK